MTRINREMVQIFFFFLPIFASCSSDDIDVKRNGRESIARAMLRKRAVCLMFDCIVVLALVRSVKLYRFFLVYIAFPHFKPIGM